MADEQNNFVEAYNKFSEDVLASNDNFQPVEHSKASSLYDSSRGIHVRPGFTRKHYEQYRPFEAIPDGKTQDELREIMKSCRSVYERVGIVKSVVDMMSEFGAQGIKIVHPDKSVQTFYDGWARKVNLEDRAERFLSWLFKSGNVVVRRKYGKMSRDNIRKIRESVVEAAEVFVDMDNFDNGDRIPLGYTFYDPSEIEMIGDQTAAFSDEKRFGIRISAIELSKFKNSSNPIHKKIYNKLPDEIKQVVEQKATPGLGQYYVVLLPEDKVSVFYYKKDDHEIWAKSFIYSILADVYYNDKVKLARISMMDNMISTVRLWKLGDHKEGLLPAPGAGAKLANILANHTGAGPVDIIWDSSISLDEFYPPIDDLSDFDENYHPILLGLGVPEGLVGGESDKKQSTVSTIGLKNLVKRLEAGRRVVREWLEYEIDLIQKTMGFRRRPEVHFDHADLHDERTYHQLLLQLVDRNILSDDRILEIIDESPYIETDRVRKQEADREAGTRPDKVSPYHNPQLEDQQEFELEKQEQTQDNSNNLSKKGTPSNEKNGRPPGSEDKMDRKRGPNMIRADLLGYAVEAHDVVDKFVTDVMLHYFDVKSLRSLTSAQRQNLEDAKSEMMACIPPRTHLSQENLIQAYQNKNNKLINKFTELLSEYVSSFNSDHVSIDQKKTFRISAYAELWGINNHEDL